MNLIDIKSVAVYGGEVLGSSIKVLARVNQTPSSITVTIEAPSTDKKITAASMTKESPNFYYYIFASTSDYEEGNYCFRVTATDSTGSCIKEEFKRLVRPYDLRILE